MNKSVKQNIEECWSVTGDNGTSRFSLILLRIMTTAFFAGTIYLVLLFTGQFDASGWPMKYQALKMVTVIVIGFSLLGLWGTISVHPLCRFNSKTLRCVAFLGYAFMGLIGFGKLKVVSDFVEEWTVNPILFSFGMPIIIAAISFIPITRLAWTMPPSETQNPQA